MGLKDLFNGGGFTAMLKIQIYSFIYILMLGVRHCGRYWDTEKKMQFVTLSQTHK
jgi:hypothetical protein